MLGKLYGLFIVAIWFALDFFEGKWDKLKKRCIPRQPPRRPSRPDYHGQGPQPSWSRVTEISFDDDLETVKKNLRKYEEERAPVAQQDRADPS